MAYIKFCPNCDKDGLQVVETEETFEIKGEEINAIINLYYCTHCGKRFSCAKDLGDPIKRALEKYEKIYGKREQKDRRDDK